jgi:hypothetical protein
VHEEEAMFEFVLSMQVDFPASDETLAIVFDDTKLTDISVAETEELEIIIYDSMAIQTMDKITIPIRMQVF